MSTTSHSPSVIPSMGDDEIDLLEVMRVIWRERALVLAVTLVPLILTVAFYLALPKQYEAGATIFPLMRNQEANNIVVAGLAAQLDPVAAEFSGLRDYQVPSMLDLLGSRELATKVAEKMRVDLASKGAGDLVEVTERVRGMVEITQVPNSRALRIHAQAASPDLAAKLANAYVASLQEHVDELVHEAARRHRELVNRHLGVTRQALEADKKNLALLRAGGSRGEAVEHQIQELEARKSLYLNLLKEREAALIAESKVSAEFVLFDEAVPHRKPKRSKFFLLIPVATLIGLTLGVMLAFARPRLAAHRSRV